MNVTGSQTPTTSPYLVPKTGIEPVSTTYQAVVIPLYYSGEYIHDANFDFLILR